MNYINLAIFIFILSAFAIGSAISEYQDVQDTLGSLDSLNLSEQINISAPPNSHYLTQGLFNTMDAWVDFAVIGMIEVYKIGINFGADNPQYFTPDFIIRIIKLIIWALVISLLIKPLTYLMVLIVLFAVWIKETIQKKRAKK